MLVQRQLVWECQCQLPERLIQCPPTCPAPMQAVSALETEKNKDKPQGKGTCQASILTLFQVAWRHFSTSPVS